MPDEALLKKLEAAKLASESADDKVADLLGQLEEAQDQARLAAIARESAEGAAFAKDIAKAKAEAKANHSRQRADHDKHVQHIEARKKAARGVDPDHTKLEVATLGDKVHQIVSAHGLKLGHHGFRGPPARKPGEGNPKGRPASRYKMACGLSVDAPHDELHHERFEQGKEVDCQRCLDAIAAGTTRSDYLTSDEQLAHARAEVKRKNRESNRPKASPRIPS